MFVVCPCEDSNLDYGIRNPASYPLNDKGKFLKLIRSIPAFGEARPWRRMGFVLFASRALALEPYKLFQRIEQRMFVFDLWQRRPQSFLDFCCAVFG